MAVSVAGAHGLFHLDTVTILGLLVRCTLGTGNIRMEGNGTCSQGVCCLSVFTRGSRQLLTRNYFNGIYSKDKVQAWLQMVSLVSLLSLLL